MQHEQWAVMWFYSHFISFIHKGIGVVPFSPFLSIKKSRERAEPSPNVSCCTPGLLKHIFKQSLENWNQLSKLDAMT